MALSAPLSLGGLDIAYPGAPSQFGQAPPQSPQPVILPGVPAQQFQPGLGFFEGPAIGNPESVTGAVNAPSSPGGPTGAPGAPSAPGATNSGPVGGLGPAASQIGMGPTTTVTDNTVAAQIGANIGLSPAVSNAAVSGAGMLSGIPGIGLANTLSGFFTDPNDTPVTAPPEIGLVGLPGMGPLGMQPAGPDNTGYDDGPTDNTVTQSEAEGIDAAVAGIGAVNNDDAADGADGSDGGDAGGDAGDSVICTELHRQGFMDDLTWEKDQAFGRSVPPDVRSGYLLWALYIVAGMRRSRAFSRLVWVVAKPWAEHMAGRPNLAGKIIMAVGMRLCAGLGRLRVAV